MSKNPQAPKTCANCDADIPRSARACPGCGADERTGWRETDATRYDGLDLPAAAFADEPELGVAPRRPLRPGLRWYWLVVAALLVGALIFGVVRFR